MSATVSTPPAPGSPQSYLFLSGNTVSGPFVQFASVTSSTTGNAGYDPATKTFFVTDPSGTGDTWYTVGASSSQGVAYSPPFQPDAAGSDLCTLADAKAYLGISGSANDALLARLITAASNWFESSVNYTIPLRLYTDVRNGDGGTSYGLRQPNPVELRSVSVDGAPVSQSLSSSAPGWALVDGRVLLNGQAFTAGLGNVSIQYTAGFAVVPGDIQQAVIEMVGLKYKDRLHLGKSTESMSGMAVSYLPSLIPQSVKDVVDSYTRITNTD